MNVTKGVLPLDATDAMVIYVLRFNRSNYTM